MSIITNFAFSDYIIRLRPGTDTHHVVSYAPSPTGTVGGYDDRWTLKEAEGNDVQLLNRGVVVGAQNVAANQIISGTQDNSTFRIRFENGGILIFLPAVDTEQRPALYWTLDKMATDAPIRLKERLDGAFLAKTQLWKLGPVNDGLPQADVPLYLNDAQGNLRAELSTSESAVIGRTQVTNDDNQQWKFVPVAEGGFTIQNIAGSGSNAGVNEANIFRQGGIYQPTVTGTGGGVFSLEICDPGFRIFLPAVEGDDPRPALYWTMGGTLDDSVVRLMESRDGETAGTQIWLWNLHFGI